MPSLQPLIFRYPPRENVSLLKAISHIALTYMAIPPPILLPRNKRCDSHVWPYYSFIHLSCRLPQQKPHRSTSIGCSKVYLANTPTEGHLGCFHGSDNLKDLFLCISSNSLLHPQANIVYNHEAIFLFFLFSPSHAKAYLIAFFSLS